MEIRDFKMSDIDSLTLDNEFEHQFRVQLKTDKSFTALIDGKVIFCAGIRIFWSGVGEAWFSLADDSFPVSTIRTAANLLVDKIVEYGLWRVQTVVRADNKKAQGFMDILGFGDKHILKKFNSDKTDSILYSLVI